MRGPVWCIVLLAAGPTLGQSVEWPGSPAPAWDGGRRPGSECGATYLCGQNPGGSMWQYSDATFSNPPYGTNGRIICEKFPPPNEPILTQPIGGIRWHGTFIDYGSGSGCHKYLLFQIKFYPDAGNQPDVLNPVRTYTVVPHADVHFRVLNFGGPYPADLYLFAAILDPPLTMASGWFSIASVQFDPECYSAIGPSEEGDGMCWRYWGDNPTGGAAQPNDIHYCLSKSDGACCYESAPCQILSRQECEASGGDCVGDLNCDGKVDLKDITPFVLYLSKNSVWESTYPGCDPLNGDINCDGTYGQGSFKDINPFIALLGSGPLPIACPGPISCGGIWLGPGTTCDKCCTADCPPGGLPEGEPTCSYGYVDNYNGGCDNTANPKFQAITCGKTICGKSGTYVTDAVEKPDADWYQVETTQNTKFTLNVQALFDVSVKVIKGPLCAGADTYASARGNVCELVTLTTECFPPGTWWFRIAPQADQGIPCDRKYIFTLDCSICPPPCDITCPQGAYQEQEPCDEEAPNLNDGCFGDGHFEAIQCETWICGTIWANNADFDDDWYVLDLSGGAAVLTVTVSTEFPMEMWVYPDGDCDNLIGYPRTIVPCPQGQPTEETFGFAGNPCFYGRVYFLLGPGTDVNQWIAEGYPCGYRNQYYFKVACDFPPCECSLYDPGLPPEGEPVCSDEYVDNYNGGCDNTANPQFQTLLEQPYLAQSGRYLVAGEWVDETDWWQIDTRNDPDACYQYEFQFQGENPVEIEFYAAGPGGNCPGTLLENYTIPACAIQSTKTQCWPKGLYWLRVNVPSDCGIYYIVEYQHRIPCSPP